MRIKLGTEVDRLCPATLKSVGNVLGRDAIAFERAGLTERQDATQQAARACWSTANHIIAKNMDDGVDPMTPWPRKKDTK